LHDTTKISSNFPSDPVTTDTTVTIVNHPIGTFLLNIGWEDNDSAITGAGGVTSYSGAAVYAGYVGGNSAQVASDETSAVLTSLYTVSSVGTVVITVNGPPGMGAGYLDLVIVSLSPGFSSSVRLSEEDQKLEDKVAKLEKLVDRLLQLNSHNLVSPGMCTPEEKECGSPALKIEQADLSKSTVSLLSSLLAGRSKIVSKSESVKGGSAGCQA